MRISDWSSDVCSSDLRDAARHRLKHRPRGVRKPGDCKPRGDPASPAGPHRPAGALSLHKKAPPGFLPTGRLIGLRRPPTWSPSSAGGGWGGASRSEEHTSELQSLMRISYAVFCLKKKKKKNTRKNSSRSTTNKSKHHTES